MKISLILPYWDRQKAADKAFELLARHYSDLNMEIVVIDDGNTIPFKKPDLPLDIKVVTLPQKFLPMCPVTPWNEGVKNASGDIVVLSCIEVLHETPVIQELVERLIKIGENGYTLAAAWCPEYDAWHCHSSVKNPRNPWGTGLSFLGAMYKEMYWKAGGFSEEFRDGAGYEDNDFINKMLAVGAKFKICDDLVVIHPKSDANIAWPDGTFARNEKLFYDKWPGSQKSLTIVCINWGDYCGRGKEYVEKLYDGVYRWLPSGASFRFICFSDVSESIPNDRGIIYQALPEGVKGWWNKLYLFKEGHFGEDERILFLDLDTIIVSPLDDIVGYDGEFAILKDFYQDRLAPGVMLWKGGFGNGIWSSYVEAGYPTDLPMGDLSWINKYATENSLKVDILQDLFPDKFVSYKLHAQDGIPKKSAVVCFHGLPRPHDAGGWVDGVWGKGLAQFESFVIPNTSVEVAIDNIRSACGLDLPWLEILPENSGDVVIVGGSPSLSDKLDEVRVRKLNGHFIISANGTHDYLIENGIIPDAHIVIDARPENVRFVENARSDVKYYIAAQCNPAVFKALEDKNVTLIHLNRMDSIAAIPPTDKPINLLSGGSTVGLSSISLAHVLGYRNFHIYGMDSSYRDDKHHAYEQNLNNNENALEVRVGEREFLAAPWMIQQAQEFQQLAAILANEGCVIKVAGDGLIPYVASLM